LLLVEVALGYLQTDRVLTQHLTQITTLMFFMLETEVLVVVEVGEGRVRGLETPKQLKPLVLVAMAVYLFTGKEEINERI